MPHEQKIGIPSADLKKNWPNTISEILSYRKFKKDVSMGKVDLRNRGNVQWYGNQGSFCKKIKKKNVKMLHVGVFLIQTIVNQYSAFS